MPVDFFIMSIFSENIRLLRSKSGKTQRELSEQIQIPPSRYSSYENGKSRPPVDVLIRMSRIFNVSIDLMLSVDLTKHALEDMLKLPDNRIVLPVVVDQNGDESIEIVPQKATMGYLRGYSDPEYIESLERISLPFLRNGKFRAFPADGDSMPPFKDGSFIIGKYMEGIHDLKSGNAYIFITLNDGITFKRLRSKNTTSITVAADNTFYEPYDIPLSEIIEVWKYATGIFPQDF
ncbi:transcriptional regulator with XRE-family HTH domain [Chryseobacterium sp. SORGH_AS909]|uniref:Transcriptional regulator with XRE-family HTH domain n=2 Tax=Chryseobacterium group TaxID=2782232 RepID=A0ABU0THD9_9FLAO|nr:transcriptional regulator with XRE-family HTH domain [Chryseobacterium camelliae]MDQ1100409.1 transcriptional regulator with XRE-family HTH domain [Chryseobacterium sp. SORGH_AS_1048]MDR6087750.1 transcriptional regulator with XRE-family HTH domain [Chryseobacterium sp. SORGH_AS_0909]MDR6132126.1 transcriptional regulator with XRE-family HTH domain [Chryseobacterium sp. SORGH_AS_1175]MDT3405721.1 transcriptional regulator with XRE-family HTH domain [Pseudacidovorax intermedius]